MFGTISKQIKNQRRRFSRWLASSRIPRFLTLDFYLQILSWPFRYMAAAWQQGRIRNLMMGLPALAAIGSMSYFISNAQSHSISSEYWMKAQKAIAAGEYPTAELLLDRILKEQKGHEGDARFALAMMYENLGFSDRATALFSVLAPDNKRGYPDAHIRLAMLLSADITTESTKEELTRLHWHLMAASNRSVPAVALAWGRYSLAIRDLVSAKQYFTIAVNEFPEMWKRLGDVNVALGNSDAAMTDYSHASEQLTAELQKRPGNHLARVDYADVLIRLGRIDEARTILEEGQRIAPEEDATWRQLLAAVYVNIHDLMSLSGNSGIGDLLQPLSKSLEYDPNFGPALNRLMSYANAKTDGNIELRDVLSRTVAEGQKPALAHLALGNLCWLEGLTEQAVFHFERARKIDNKLSVVMNNLAWLIAHDEKNRDLDKALALVNEALIVSPDDSRFLDTRGTILFLQKDWNNALDDLEKAIDGVSDKTPTHLKLAEIYDNLDLPDIAAQHRLLAVQPVPADGNKR